jgi:beta-phosphoglucomutase-like phosphatase (HAD superfamily)
VRVLLCDADGTLFPSEEAAFAAATPLANAALASIGIDRSFEPEALRRFAAGRNFRQFLTDLATDSEAAFTRADLDQWVETELQVVSDHLGTVLAPDSSVVGPLTRIATTVPVAVVSSSASARLEVCLGACGLLDLFARDRIFSAIDSLPVPTSKPDPAVYLAALAQLDVPAQEAMAVEDAVAGVRSSVAAGIETVGMVAFVPADERTAAAASLTAAGAARVVDSWEELAGELAADVVPA